MARKALKRGTANLLKALTLYDKVEQFVEYKSPRLSKPKPPKARFSDEELTLSKLKSMGDEALCWEWGCRVIADDTEMCRYISDEMGSRGRHYPVCEVRRGGNIVMWHSGRRYAYTLRLMPDGTLKGVRR